MTPWPRGTTRGRYKTANTYRDPVMVISRFNKFIIVFFLNVFGVLVCKPVTKRHVKEMEKVSLSKEDPFKDKQ